MRKAKIGECPFCSARHSRDYRCEAEFEAWEIDYELREKEEYAGLVAHYEAVVEWYGDGFEGLCELGDAYVLNGEPDKAIELLSEPHRQDPLNEEFQRVILDALFALGKDETAFDWVECIPVLRRGSDVLDRCHAYLKPKRKPRSVYELHTELTIDGYCVFSPEELLEAIRGDERFVVEEEAFWSPDIRARRKREKRAQPGSRTPRTPSSPPAAEGDVRC